MASAAQLLRACLTREYAHPPYDHASLPYLLVNTTVHVRGLHAFHTAPCLPLYAMLAPIISRFSFNCIRFLVRFIQSAVT